MATKVFTFVFAALGLALLFACSTTPVPHERADAGRAPAFVKDLPQGIKLGASVKVDGAEIHALLDPAAPAATEFVTLDEAMEQKACTVREVGEGGSVNTLKISNSGTKPIFCMAGDLVLGGQQDRILAESLVVEAGAKDQDIPVFCVEHGRWQTQDKDGDHAKARTFLNDGERGQVDLNVKKAALESRNQGAVWNEVARNNSKLAVAGQTQSGTFRATYDDETTRTKIERNFTAAQKLLGKGVVGFAVVCKGELVAMDVFESSELCAKLSNKLLRSYVITGIGGGYESTANPGQFGNNSGGAAPVNLSSGIYFNTPDSPDVHTNSNQDSRGRLGEQQEQTRGQTRVTGGRSDEPPTETPPAPVATTVNTNTETCREYTREALKYDCKDKKSGRTVQRSFLKR